MRSVQQRAASSTPNTPGTPSCDHPQPRWVGCLGVVLMVCASHASAEPTVAAPQGGATPVASTSRPSPQALLEGADWVPAPAKTAATTPPAPPQPSEDPVLRLLVDRGLMPPPAQATSLAGQVKDRASDLAADMVIAAMEFLGVPYRLGGNSAEEGFDCSGFTRHVFENSLGLILPRRASEQAHAPGLVPVARHDLKPGDLVFFNTLRRTFSHVGIYIGDDKFIHAPRSGAKVRIEDMRLNYWRQRFDGARRATPDTLSQRDATAPTP